MDKRAEEENKLEGELAKGRLTETAQLFDATQKLAKAGSWKLDLTTNTPVWTKGVYDIHELEATQALELDQAIDFYVPKDRKRIRQAIEAAVQNHQDFDLTCRLRTAKDNLRWVRVTGKPVMPTQGEVEEVVGLIMDITDQQEASQALKKQADMQQLLMMMASEFINLPLREIPTAIKQALGRFGRFVQADRAYVFSVDRRQQTATNTFEWCAEGISPQIDNMQNLALSVIPSIFQALEQGQMFYLPDVNDLPPSPQRQMLVEQDIKSLIVVPMMERGKCTGFIGFDAVRAHKTFTTEERQILLFFAQMLLNVQLRSAAEAQLQQNQEALQKLTASVPGAMFQLERTPDGKMHLPFISEGIKEIFPGIPLKTIKKGVFLHLDFIAEPDRERLLQRIQQSAETLRNFSEEYRVKMPDGSLRWHTANLKPQKRADGTVVWYGIFLDITRQKELDEIKSRARELEVKNKEMEQFAYVASHDLQEPLRTIHSFVGMLRRRPSVAQDEEALKFIQFAQGGAERMQQLIKGLLQYSELGAGYKQREHIDLPQLLQAVLQDLSSTISEKEANVQIGQIPQVITGYPLEVRLLFQNLISNALKFHKKGEKPEIYIEGETQIGYWLFYVKDNGIGIPDQHQHRIFKIFQRLHHRSAYEGTGIGLSFCKKIVELHHGHISVSSQEGVGSTFAFSIYCTNEQDETTTKPRTAD
ncbi:MAG: PAS domain-containing protein [Bacteroidetes bacterium]|jgi:PAS domain S-box-containing protein|nr:PAS domain-containing protein [Bacteroidota bacterium]